MEKARALVSGLSHRFCFLKEMSFCRGFYSVTIAVTLRVCFCGLSIDLLQG